MRSLQIDSVYGYESTGRIVEKLHQAIKDICKLCKVINIFKEFNY